MVKICGGTIEVECGTCGVRTNAFISRIATDGTLSLLRGQASAYCRCGGNGIRADLDVAVSQDPGNRPVVKLSTLAEGK